MEANIGLEGPGSHQQAQDDDLVVNNVTGDHLVIDGQVMTDQQPDPEGDRDQDALANQDQVLNASVAVRNHEAESSMVPFMLIPQGASGGPVG